MPATSDPIPGTTRPRDETLRQVKERGAVLRRRRKLTQTAAGLAAVTALVGLTAVGLGDGAPGTEVTTASSSLAGPSTTLADDGVSESPEPDSGEGPAGAVAPTGTPGEPAPPPESSRESEPPPARARESAPAPAQRPGGESSEPAKSPPPAETTGAVEFGRNCPPGPGDRPAVLNAAFFQAEVGDAMWTFDEARSAMAAAGVPLTVIDRIGRDNWRGGAAAVGDAASLTEAARALGREQRRGGTPSIEVACGSRHRLRQDIGLVLREGADIDSVVADEGSGHRVTSRPEQGGRRNLYSVDTRDRTQVVHALARYLTDDRVLEVYLGGCLEVTTHDSDPEPVDYDEECG